MIIVIVLLFKDFPFIHFRGTVVETRSGQQMPKKSLCLMRQKTVSDNRCNAFRSQLYSDFNNSLFTGLWAIFVASSALIIDMWGKSIHSFCNFAVPDDFTFEKTQRNFSNLFASTLSYHQHVML